MAKKRKLNRREFAKLAGGAVAGGAGLLAAETGALDTAAAEAAAARPAVGAGLAQSAAAPAAQSREAASDGSGLNLPPEMEERVKQARERTARQLRGLRERPIAYDAEPAFAFRAKAGKKK